MNQATAGPKRTIFSFFRRTSGRGPFITRQGHCAVCQKTFMAGSREALDLSGWRVNGDVGVCPDCQAKGWQ
jgi:hypothetical protein